MLLTMSITSSTASQTTLKRAICLDGIGLHSGAPVAMSIKPAKAGTGIRFRRLDHTGSGAMIPARYDLVSATRLGTTLTNAHGVSVATVEHLMAALWGAGIDNALISLDGPEVPIMDGSSAPFSAALAEAGVKVLNMPRRVLRVLAPVTVHQGDSAATVTPYDGEAMGCQLDVTIDFNHKVIPQGRAVYDFPELSFDTALAAARTFGFAHEVEALRAAGLARGGSLHNAVVVGDTGVLNKDGLRFDDEFLRHKALDCLGDLYLAGCRIEGAFRFIRPGHGINNALLHALFAQKEAFEWVEATPVPIRSSVMTETRPVAYF